MYKLFLTVTYLCKRRIAYFAIAAVMLCTMMVLVVSSVMGGFLDKIKFKARGLLGDIIVQNHSARGFPLYEEFIREVKEWPEVEAAAPVVFTVGVLNFKDSTVMQVVNVTGVQLQEIYKINAFKSSLFYERYYPGTTRFEDQPQPLLGFDPLLSPQRKDRRDTILPVLPEDHRLALEQSRRAGVTDRDSVETEYNELLREEGLPPVPGYFGVNKAESENELPAPAYAGEAWPGLIIGRDLVAIREADGRYDRRLPRGALVTATIVPITDNGNPESPVRQPFRYADDSRTGIYEIDSKHIYCDFSLLQRIMLMGAAERADGSGPTPARCSQIQIRLRTGADGRSLCRRMQELYRGYANGGRFQLSNIERRLIDGIEVLTWEQSQAHFIAPVEKERVLVTILFAIISLVAAVLVLCILYMIVLQKTRDIGVVKALGGSSTGVASIFLLYGAAVGIVGAIIGATLGYLLVVNINEIQDFLISINPRFRVWDRSVYSFDEIPNTVRTSDLIFIVATGIGLSILGSLAAAVRAGRMHPVESLRYE